MRTLTVRQENFVKAYLTNGRNGLAAYRSAYDAKRMSDSSINKEVGKLLKHPLITPRIAQVIERAQNKTAVTVERVLAEYAKIGFADIRKAVRWANEMRKPDILTNEEDAPEVLESSILLVPSDEIDDDTAAAISEVAHTAQGIKIKFHDKKAALDSIAKNLGMFVDRTEITGANGTPIVPVLNVTITRNQS